MTHTTFFIFAILNILVMLAGFHPALDTFTAPEALATACAVNFQAACFISLYTNSRKRRAIIQRIA